jgi:hypothetical protein
LLGPANLSIFLHRTKAANVKYPGTSFSISAEVNRFEEFFGGDEETVQFKQRLFAAGGGPPDF